jgi:hypothetical protein
MGTVVTSKQAPAQHFQAHAVAVLVGVIIWIAELTAMIP